ncbi:MAG: hypothetical protein FJ194_11555 [Gammaproteobacteria bacterium]|nr:hypothetical protein [Gammaproteobacteria bacterium]
MTVTVLCAWMFTTLSVLTILFQIALAFGAPWGEFTMGGKHRGVLPGMWRLIPVVSTLILAGFIFIVLVRAGVILDDWKPLSHTLIWIVVGYSVLGCIANSATPSPRERMVWLPVVIVLSATSLIVALSAR